MYWVYFQVKIAPLNIRYCLIFDDYSDKKYFKINKCDKIIESNNFYSFLSIYNLNSYAHFLA